MNKLIIILAILAICLIGTSGFAYGQYNELAELEVELNETASQVNHCRILWIEAETEKAVLAKVNCNGQTMEETQWIPKSQLDVNQWLVNIDDELHEFDMSTR